MAGKIELQAMELTSMACLLAASEALRERHSNGLRELYQRAARSTQSTSDEMRELYLPPLVYCDDTPPTAAALGISTSDIPIKASFQRLLLNLELQQQRTDWAIQSFLDASSMARREEEIKARETIMGDELRSLSTQIASMKAEKATMQEEWAREHEAWSKKSRRNEQEVKKLVGEMASLKKLLALTRTEAIELKQSSADTNEKIRCLSAEVHALQTNRKQLELRADIIEARYIVDMVKQKRGATAAMMTSSENGKAPVTSKDMGNIASGAPGLTWPTCPVNLSTSTSSFILPHCQASDYIDFLDGVNGPQNPIVKLQDFDGTNWLPRSWLVTVSFSLTASAVSRSDWPGRVGSAFKGTAAQWFCTLQREYPPNSITWPILKHEFLTHFVGLQETHDAKIFVFTTPGPAAENVAKRRTSRSRTPRK